MSELASEVDPDGAQRARTTQAQVVQCDESY